jgi:hypothetical protein
MTEKRQYLKNYVVGQKKTVNIGEPMVKFQDYLVETVESSVASPERTLNLKGGTVDITLYAGQRYPVRGRMVVDGSEYTVVATTNTPNYAAVLVRQDGTLLDREAIHNSQVGGLVLVVYRLTISDPSVRLIRDSQQNVKSTNGYENFELIYTGTNANSLNIAYREFSPDGLARAAFFQNLTYEAGSRFITFKNFRIAIENASSETITFTVVSDGT